LCKFSVTLKKWFLREKFGQNTPETKLCIEIDTEDIELKLHTNKITYVLIVLTNRNKRFI